MKNVIDPSLYTHGDVNQRARNVLDFSSDYRYPAFELVAQRVSTLSKHYADVVLSRT
jgi:hypothetical protein